MYESYAWPGAYTYKEETKLFVKWFKQFMDGILKEIAEKEKKV